MSNSKDRAVGLLMHYLEQAGFKPEEEFGRSDFCCEMEGLVESIADYVIERLRERAEQRDAAEAKLHAKLMDELEDF